MLPMKTSPPPHQQNFDYPQTLAPTNKNDFTVTSQIIIFPMEFLDSLQGLFQVDVGDGHLSDPLGQTSVLGTACAGWHRRYHVVGNITILCESHMGVVGAVHIDSLLHLHSLVFQ